MDKKKGRGIVPFFLCLGFIDEFDKRLIKAKVDKFRIIDSVSYLN